MTKGMIHDTISTNSVACRYLRLCCCHDKSSFFPAANQHISVDHLIRWLPPGFGRQQKVIYNTPAWNTSRLCLQTLAALMMTWSLFCMTTRGNNAACLITITIVFLKHTVRCARYYKICSRVSLSPLHHFDVTIKQFAGRSRMCRS